MAGFEADGAAFRCNAEGFRDLQLVISNDAHIFLFTPGVVKKLAQLFNQMKGKGLKDSRSSVKLPRCYTAEKPIFAMKGILVGYVTQVDRNFCV